MPLPVIADTYQVVLNWTNANAPRDASTVFHWFDNIGTQNEANLNADLEASVSADLWRLCSAAARVNAMRITALDGVSAGVSYTVASAAKWTGAGGSDCILQGSQVISLKSAVRGPRGRNRMFLPWISETDNTNGALGSAGVALMQTAWDNFTAAMFTAGWILSAVSSVHNEGNLVTSTTPRSVLNTQRRRARR